MSFRDPFTQVFDKMWAVLENDDTPNGFASLVKPGNRIKFSGAARLPQKTNPSTNDYMEVMIVPAPGGSINLFQTSDTSMFMQNYAIKYRTGDLRVDARLFPVKWAIIRAFSRVTDTFGLSFVEKVRIVDSFEDAFVSENTRTNDEGWQVSLVVSVTFRFTRNELANGEFQ